MYPGRVGKKNLGEVVGTLEVTALTIKNSTIKGATIEVETRAVVKVVVKVAVENHASKRIVAHATTETCTVVNAKPRNLVVVSVVAVAVIHAGDEIKPNIWLCFGSNEWSKEASSTGWPISRHH
jgi:hypothetical protein